MFIYIFSIENPEQFSCVIRKYVFGHSVLHIEMINNSRPPDLLYAAFYPVEYFEGPVVWQGVNLEIAQRDETLEILRHLEKHRDAPFEKLLESPYSLKLFKFMTPKNLVKIVATEVKVHKEEWILG